MNKAITTILFFVISLQALTIVTDRNESGDKAIFEAYGRVSGEQLEVIHSDTKNLENNIDRADVLFLRNGAALFTNGLISYTIPIKSTIIDDNIQTNLKDLDNRWIAVTKRASLVVYNKNLELFLQDYGDLVNYIYANKLIISNINDLDYRVLFAFVKMNFNEDKAKYLESVLKDSQNSFNKDNKTQEEVLEILEKNKFISLVSSDVFFRYVINHQRTRINALVPNQYTVGANMNISTLSIVEDSKNQKKAKEFIEFMVSKKAQDMFQKLNYEYPVNKDSKVVDTLKIIPSFVEDISYIGDLYSNIY